MNPELLKLILAGTVITTFLVVFPIVMSIIDVKTLNRFLKNLFQRRNRKVVKLLKRYVKYISWKQSEYFPEWMHQELVWGGIDGGTIVMRKYRTVLGKRDFIGKEFIRPKALDSEDEVSILRGIMSKEGTDSPEEFDLWLSQRGF